MQHTNNPQEDKSEGLIWSVLMDSIAEQLSHRFNSYSNGNGQNTSYSSIAIEKKLTKKEEDAIVDSFSDIIDPNYRVWFIKQLKRVGKARFIEAGEKARKYGRNPSMLFSDLLRQ